MTNLPLPPATAAVAVADMDGTGEILRRTARGAGWIVGWRMATRLLGLVNTLILTRLLLPTDFGLVALGSSFVASLDSMSALGVEDALVREKAPSRALYDTGFTINLLRSGLTGGLLALTAFPIAGFFREPRLAYVLLALAFGTFVSGLANIGTVDFRRQLKFELEFRLLVLPRIVSVLVTIGVALATQSYWALIAGILTGRGLAVAFSYWMHPYRPSLTLSAWRSLAGFSGWTWALNIAALVRDRTDGFFIGWSLNAAQVGIYSLGIEIADLPTTELVGPLGRACFSGFAAARHGGEASGQTYLRVVSAVTLLTFPVAVGISLLADPLVRLAFGPRWLEAIPVIQVLGLFCATTVFGQISSSLFSAHAMLRTMFRITLAVMALRVALLVALVPRMGILGAVFAAGIPMLVEYATYVTLTFSRFGLQLRNLWRAIWRPLVAVLAMAGCLYGLGLGWTETSGGAGSLALQMAGAASLGAVIYVGTVAGLWFALGRPAGAETDLLALGRRFARRTEAV